MYSFRSGRSKFLWMTTQFIWVRWLVWSRVFEEKTSTIPCLKPTKTPSGFSFGQFRTSSGLGVQGCSAKQCFVMEIQDRSRCIQAEHNFRDRVEVIENQVFCIISYVYRAANFGCGQSFLMLSFVVRGPCLQPQLVKFLLFPYVLLCVTLSLQWFLVVRGPCLQP